MKRCPQCQQTFSDEYSFCLSDGTPLDPGIAQAEIPTVVKPRAAVRSRGRSALIFVLAALLSLSLGVTAAVLYYFWPRTTAVISNMGTNNSQDNRGSNNSSPTPESTLTPTPTATPDRDNELPSPEPRGTPDDEPPFEADPPPTRLTFERGRSQATVSGTVVRQRSYLLFASEGQDLDARLDSGEECVFFENGSSRVRYPTSQGDNVLIVINDCEVPTRFRLNVRIR